MDNKYKITYNTDWIKLILLLSFLFSCSLANLTEAQTSTKQTLDSLENQLFFSTFPKESSEARVTRLEKKILGEANDGPVNKRLEILTRIVSEQKKDIFPTVSNPTTPAPLNTQATSTRTNSFNKTPPADLSSEARVSVQEARVQEIHDLLQDGAKLWRSKHPQEALEHFEQVLRLDPQNAEANFSMGVIEESTGNINQAYASYQNAAKYNPDNKDYREALSSIENKFHNQHQEQPEIKQLQEAASTAFKRGEYISAIDLYKRLDLKTPDQASVKFNLGTIYLMLKDPFNALEYYKQANKLEPNNKHYKQAYNELSEQVKKFRKESKAQNTPVQQQWNHPPGLAPGAASIRTNGFAPPVGRSNFNTQQQMIPQQQFIPQQQQQMIPQQQFIPQQQQQMIPQQQFIPQQQQQRMSPWQTMPPQQQTVPLKPENILTNFGLHTKGSREGIIITKVISGSRAERAGLKNGDRIRAVNGVEVLQTFQLSNVLLQSNPAQLVPMIVLRKNNLIVINF